MLRQRSPAAKNTTSTTSSSGMAAPSNPNPSAAQENTSLLTKSQTSSPPSASDPQPTEAPHSMDISNLSARSQWIALAVASGACAAFNGVFAKLTTTELTTRFATWVAGLIGLASVEGGVEVVVRATFFLLNLLFNGIMWTLFTKALARGTSTTQVSILNTSSNFMITAVLGWLIFSESLPSLWFVGAAMLVAGNVIIGRRDEGEDKAVVVGEGDREGEERGVLVGESVELDEGTTDKKQGNGSAKGNVEDEDILDLGLEDEGAKSDEDLIPDLR